MEKGSSSEIKWEKGLVARAEVDPVWGSEGDLDQEGAQGGTKDSKRYEPGDRGAHRRKGKEGRMEIGKGFQDLWVKWVSWTSIPTHTGARIIGARACGGWELLSRKSVTKNRVHTES